MHDTIEEQIGNNFLLYEGDILVYKLDIQWGPQVIVQQQKRQKSF